MDIFGQHASNSQSGHSYTQDLVDIEVYSRDDFNLYQQTLLQPQRCVMSDYPGPNVDSCQMFRCSAINPSYLNGNGSRNLPNDYANSQAKVLIPDRYREPETPWLTYLNHDDLIQTVRPPYSYLALIAMDIQNAPEKKLTLRQIYNYVVDKFSFYRRSKTNWQHCIRHSLTNNDGFKKVARDESDPEKGGYWTLEPNCDKILDNGHFKEQWKRYNESKSHPAFYRKPLRVDSLAESPATDMKYFPSLDSSHFFANFTSSVISMRSNGASTQLTEDFSLYKPYFTELSTCPSEVHHNCSLQGKCNSQVNLLQTLTLPNQFGSCSLLAIILVCLAHLWTCLMAFMTLQ
ncbi:forkhead box protein I2-like [Phyllobates terribilis]|uniref:forkhead box protein I2-like n=1 Tax=Phyllobates terribilis TaxID=111132 RepID=UPI003CCB13BD